MIEWVRSRLGYRWFPWSVVALLLALAPLAGVIGWLATVAQYRDTPPPCYGIGWGCSLSPRVAGLLFGTLWLMSVAVIAAVLSVTELFWRPVAVARSIVLLVILVFALGVLVVIGAQGLLALG